MLSTALPGQRAGRGAGGTQAAAVRVLDVVPAMRDAIPAEERAYAYAAMVAAAQTTECGPLRLPATTAPGRPFAAIIVSGAVLRETSLGDRCAGELFGAGDVIDIGGGPETELSLVPAQTVHTAHQPVTLALLGNRFRAAASRWPGLHDVLGEQRAQQVRRASRHLAILALPRVDERIVALFGDLAERWGHVTPEGIRIDLPLTHVAIGQLVGARRPTVSLALTDLAAAGRLSRRPDRSWLLHERAGMAA
jgi:CRP/FNR family cyclic AMP-dependent transcriptional regulator